MKKLLLLFAVMASLAGMAQPDNPYDHCGEQFATQGTDFWVCFPRTVSGLNRNLVTLYVVSERDCDVTVEAPQLDWWKTVHIMHRQMCGPDTNYITIPFDNISRIVDTIYFPYPLVHNAHYTNALMNKPQPRGFHVYSTDTISLFVFINSQGVGDAANVIPTEMLRDEYVIQVYPTVYEDTIILSPIPRDSIQLPTVDVTFLVSSPYGQTIDIVATEDSTVVDIVLSDPDLVGRSRGDTVTVLLNAGQLYHMAAANVREKYYPLFPPYYYPNTAYASILLRRQYRPVFNDRSFGRDELKIDTFCVDLSGTHIKARDCKRIAVFEGGSRVYIPSYYDGGTSDMILSQVVPVRYAGTKFLIPNLYNTPNVYTRITALHDSTEISILDADRGITDIRRFTIHKGQTFWFKMSVLRDDDGPFYIETSKPAIVKNYSDGAAISDEASYAVIPEEWWHHGQINYGTITNVDENNNRAVRRHTLYVFAHTEDVASLRIDDYPVASYFNPISGTPFSFARFPYTHSFNSEGTHRIKSVTDRRFMAVQASFATHETAIFNLPHLQPGGVFLYVNNRPADALPDDTLWCHFDHIDFRAVNNRPADSLLWDFGDGTRLAFSHHDPQYLGTVPHTFPAPGVYTVRAIFIYEDEGCFTRTPDTLSVTLPFGGHVDTTITATVCEGSFLFRDHEYTTTDTHTFTTYWTTTGCDTLWIIDLTVCPHCNWVTQTISTEDFPHTFNGIQFNHEVTNYPIYIPINDSCDSIIYYTLNAIPNWGEPPIDSTWVLVPNVFTPTQGTNNRFALTCSHHILQAEVAIYDRRGDFVTRFDGLSGHWDGTRNGVPCPQGSYVYYVRYIDTHDQSWKTLTGTVTLLR